MPPIILREENSKSSIYVKELGRIKLHDMSLINDSICMKVVDSLYHELSAENSLNPPFKKLDLEEGLLRKIVSLSRDPRNLEHKYKEIEEIKNELTTKYSVNFA